MWRAPFPQHVGDGEQWPWAPRPSASPIPPGGVTALPLASPLGRMKAVPASQKCTLRAASGRGDVLAKSVITLILQVCKQACIVSLGAER